MKKLTQKLVDSVVLPRQKCVILRDTELKGFGLRVSPNSRSYVVEARVNGKSKRLTVGRADLLSVEEARNKAIAMLAQMTTGTDPQEENRKLEASTITLGEVLDHYLTVQRLRPGTVVGTRRLINKHLRSWLGKSLTSITPEMVQTRHNELGAIGQSTANTVIKKLGTLINFAANNCGLVMENPVMIMNKNRAWFKLIKSPVVIPDHQLPAWYAAVSSLKQTKVRDFFLLLLFTGLRRTEALTLRWSDIDFESQTLTIRPELSKNFCEHKLPLNDFLLALLTERKAKCNGSIWVFPRSRFPEQHMSNPQDAVAFVAKYSGVRFSPHSCRRSFATIASRMGIPHPIVRKLLNHSQVPDLTCQYIIIGTECLREPMQRISEKLLELMGCAADAWLPNENVSTKRSIKVPTLAEVMRQYMLSKSLRLTTQTNYEKSIRVDLGDWLPLEITAITEPMIEQRKQELVLRKSAVTVNLTFGVLRALLNFAAATYETPIGRPVIARNPVRNLKRYGEDSCKQSKIDDELLPKYYAAAKAIKWTTSRDYMLFVLLTAMHKNEAATLEWSDVDFDLGVINIRSSITRNGRGYCLPLSAFLRDFLNQRQLVTGKSKYVFPGRADRGHLRSSQLAIAEIGAAMGQKFVLEDLRRTFAHSAIQTGVPLHMIKQLMNHRGVRDSFERMVNEDIEQLKEAMERVSARLLGLMKCSMDDWCGTKSEQVG